MGASHILGNWDKPRGIRGVSPRSPLCLPKFPSTAQLPAPHSLLGRCAGQVWDAPICDLWFGMLFVRRKQLFQKSSLPLNRAGGLDDAVKLSPQAFNIRH